MTFSVLLVALACTALAASDTCPDKCFCSTDMTSVNCAGKHLTSLPPDIPTTVTKLFLSNNDFAEISSGEFSRLTNLERLVMNNNKLTNIQPFAFANLSLLSYIDLRNNKLQSLGPNAFANMIRLNQLYIANNQLNNIDKMAFRNSTLSFLNAQANDFTDIPDLGPLSNLKELILSENALTGVTFPESYRKCKRLSYIILAQNKIKSLTNVSFATLSNNSISTLSLSMNTIAIVDSATFNPLASIASLKLGNNPLDSANLKSALKGLHGKVIVSLDISHLQLDQIMNDTFALLKNMTIKSLNMRYNNLPHLRNFAFAGLNDLMQLDISNCGIQTTSEKAFDGMNKLIILNMEKNKLSDVPRNLPSSLNFLYMDNNVISSIHDNAFGNLAVLKELRIRYNKIVKLEENALYGLSNLAKLSLYNNYIATLPGKLFNYLIRLTSLDLASNNLVNIQSSSGRFSSLGSLVYLSLADNKCQYFQPDLLKDLLSLKYLHLEGNLLGGLVAGDYGGEIFMGLKKLNKLYLMDNGLTAIPDPTFQDLNSLTYLNISKNKITGWGNNLFKTTANLATLDLSFNLIATVKQEDVQDFTSMQTWNLTGSPFACNCDLRWFRDWINKTKVTLSNLKSYRCNTPPDWAGKPLLSFDRSKINCEHYTLKFIIISCAVVAVVVIIIVVIIYKRRWHIKLCCYKMTRRAKRGKRLAADGRGGYGAIPEEGGKRYDAYVSCSEDDKTWALEHLLPGIDKGQINPERPFGGEYDLYYDDRDAVPGESMVGNIFENMSSSRKVIVVLSRHYLADRMHLFEMDQAINRMYDHELEEIIVVHIDQGLPQRKIPRYLLKTMKRHQVIEWSDDANARELFTRTLADKLKVKANAADLEAE